AAPRAGPRSSLDRLVPDDDRTGPEADRHLEPPPEPPSRLGALLRQLVPAGWRGARIDPGRPGATALALVAAAAAVLAAVGVWFERPRAEPVPELPAVSVSAPEADAPAAA